MLKNEYKNSNENDKYIRVIINIMMQNLSILQNDLI